MRLREIISIGVGMICDTDYSIGVDDTHIIYLHDTVVGVELWGFSFSTDNSRHLEF
jgi:hypothetical protein